MRFEFKKCWNCGYEPREEDYLEKDNLIHLGLCPNCWCSLEFEIIVAKR